MTPVGEKSIEDRFRGEKKRVLRWYTDTLDGLTFQKKPCVVVRRVFLEKPKLRYALNSLTSTFFHSTAMCCQWRESFDCTKVYPTRGITKTIW